ncbi:hypothetical protein I317_02246 [Kwoniella heveanensis CBS 569]|nr:hypothetical protein I317_02246 [Kwoniella heveanensis CBS 569]
MSREQDPGDFAHDPRLGGRVIASIGGNDPHPPPPPPGREPLESEGYHREGVVITPPDQEDYQSPTCTSSPPTRSSMKTMSLFPTSSDSGPMMTDAEIRASVNSWLKCWHTSWYDPSLGGKRAGGACDDCLNTYITNVHTKYNSSHRYNPRRELFPNTPPLLSLPQVPHRDQRDFHKTSELLDKSGWRGASRSGLGRGMTQRVPSLGNDGTLDPARTRDGPFSHIRSREDTDDKSGYINRWVQDTADCVPTESQRSQGRTTGNGHPEDEDDNFSDWAFPRPISSSDAVDQTTRQTGNSRASQQKCPQTQTTESSSRRPSSVHSSSGTTYVQGGAWRRPSKKWPADGSRQAKHQLQ